MEFKPEELDLLRALLLKPSKSAEELKAIHDILRTTSFFAKVFEQYEQSLNYEGIQKVCNLIRLEEFRAERTILREGDPSNDKVYLIVRGSAFVYQKQPLDDFTTRYIRFKDLDLMSDASSHTHHGVLINVLHVGDLFGEKATFAKDGPAKRSASVVCNHYCGCLVIYKSQFDEVFKWFGQQFLDKHKALCKLIPSLSEMSSKKMLETLVYQFEDCRHPNGTVITTEQQKGDFLYFLADGSLEFRKGSSHVCDVDCLGIVGDELLQDPDSEQKQLEYLYTVRVKSAFALVYKIRLRTFTKLFPLMIIRALIIQHQQKLHSRQEFGQTKHSVSKSQSVKVLPRPKLSKIDIKLQDQIDGQFQNYQVPKYSKVLKFNKKKLDTLKKQQKVLKSKLTMNEFVQLSKKADASQMKLLQKVENPYDFASNVNSQGFLKQYYANLIRVGLVRPISIQEPQDQERICRARISSALRIVNDTAVKSRRTLSAASSIYEPQIQIVAYRSPEFSKKKSQESSSIYFQTPRGLSQPLIQSYHTPVVPRTPSPPSTAPQTAPQKTKPTKTLSTAKSQIFRPQSGFMDHSSRLSMCSEVNRRLRKPNQYFL